MTIWISQRFVRDEFVGCLTWDCRHKSTEPNCCSQVKEPVSVSRVDRNGSVEWVVKYGNITFNQFSLEMPVSGMNEAGLAVALMWHEEGDCGIDERYLRLSSLQWIQYQLDNFKNIDEVVEGLQVIRPEQGPMPLHFMLLDSHGDCLIVEFIGGELVLQKNADYPIVTNTSCEKCIEALTRSEGDVYEILGNSVGWFVP